MNKSKISFTFLFLILAFAIAGRQTSAQSSLFNIQTTDVVETGGTYLEADFDGHFGKYDEGGFQSYGGMAVYGLTKRVEIGVNAYFTKYGDPGHSWELQPNAKVQIYKNDENGVAVAAGGILYIPLNNRSESDTFGSAYAVVSKQVKGKYGPRFTGGGYVLLAQKKESGNRKGISLGYEQPLHKRVSFVADWNSGNNRFGYSAAGLSIKVTGNSGLYTAYYFGNEGRANNFLGVYYGISF